MEAETLRRLSEPTQYDVAPFGTKCIVENTRIFMQMSKDEDHPKWIEIEN